MDEALIEHFYGILEDTYVADLWKIMLQQATQATFLDTFESATLKWGKSNHTSRMENRNRMLAPWHPNDCMSKLWRHLKSCANYGFYAGETVPDNRLQDAALIVINRSCAYNQCYLDFKCEAYQSFANVKIFFDAAEANRSEVMEEAGAHCYGMNAFGDFLYNIYIICSICSIYTIYILFIIFILYILSL